LAETIEKAKNQLLDFWSNLEKKNKYKLIIGILLLLIVFTGTIFFITRTEYEILYSDLSKKDAGIITTKLDEQSMDWKFGEDETTILVPKENKSKIMIDLASEGLPKEGYSILDALNETSWTMTEYEKKERVKYAVESQISSTISQIEGIEQSNVIVDIPEDTNFMNENEISTASVFVTLTDTTPLNNEKVVAIQTLVSSSFKDMTIENVNIIDDSGRSYSDTEENTENYDVTDQLGMKQGFENKLNNSITRFLENLFGNSNVDVRSNVNMNFDSEITNIVEFTPPIEDQTEGLIRSMEKIEEHTVGGISEDPVGTESNVEDTTDYVTDDNASSKYDKASEVINYELNEINRQIKKSPGEVESVTVAVLINENAIDGELTGERQKEIEELIYAATGINTQEVVVSTGEFNKPEVVTPPNSNNNLASLPSWSYALIGALALGIIIIGVIVYRRRNKKDSIDEDISIDSQIDSNEYIEDIDFETEKSQYKSKINDFVKKKPDAVAQLLRSWLNEE